MSTKPTNKTEIIKEIIRCGKDPVYFIKTYGLIQHATKGLVPFNLYPFQEDIIRAYTTHRKNIFLKARQLGVTTTTAAYIAWLILFHRDKNVLIVSTKQETSKNMIRVVRNIFKYLPRWLLDVGKIKIDNRHSIELENGSRVKAVTTSADVGRSEALSLLVIDECAIIRNMSEIWTGLWPCVSTGGCIALFSTPKGTGNFFHQCYEMAKNKENDFNCFLGEYVNPNNPDETTNCSLPWWVHPEHDRAWFEAECAGKGEREVAQEYLCLFNTSGDTFIYHDDLARLAKHIKDPIDKLYIDKNVWVWENPVNEGSYLIACDVSRGDAADFSAFHVVRLDVQPLRQVAEYKGKIKPDQLGLLLMNVSKHYNNSIIAPENNSGWSGQTILKIEEANYPHLYYSRRHKSKEKEHFPVDPFYAATRNDFLPGYSITQATRLPMLAKLEQYIRMNEIEIYSSRLLTEFETFIVTEFNRPEALRGYNDDLVMALAGVLWVREEAFMYTYRSDEMTKAMINSMSISKTPTKSFSDFNFNNNNSYDRCRVERHVNEQNKIILGNGDEMSLDWLIKKG